MLKVWLPRHKLQNDSIHSLGFFEQELLHYFIGFNLEKRYPLGKLDIWITPKLLHLVSKTILTWSNWGSFPKNLPNRECWKWRRALAMASPSMRMNSKVLAFSLFKAGPSTSGEGLGWFLAAVAISAQERGEVEGYPPLAMPKRGDGEGGGRERERETKIVVEEEERRRSRTLGEHEPKASNFKSDRRIFLDFISPATLLSFSGLCPCVWLFYSACHLIIAMSDWWV